MEFKDKIKSRRLELGLTLEDVANKMGVSTPTIQRYESGEIQNMRRDKVKRLADALCLSPAYLMGWEDKDDTADLSKYDNIIPITTQKLPLIGEIACGEPIFATEDKETYIEVGTDVKADFCLKAKGDSMIGARILDGDIVFIKQQSTVENGEIAVVIIDDEATLKRVYYYPDENLLKLVSENPSIKPFVYEGNVLEQVRILGKAVAFQSNVK